MSITVGVRNFCKVVANVLFTTNIVPGTIGLLSPLPANQKQKVRAWIPFTVGATGGVRVVIALPAGAVLIGTIRLTNTVAPSSTFAIRTDGTAFTNALANAGTHWLEIEGDVENGATAGNIDIQLAQNTSDAATLTVLQGGSMDVVKYS